MVIDTTVFAYALLRVPGFRAEAARVLERAPSIEVPDLFRAELANVVWKAVRTGFADVVQGREALRRAERLLLAVVPSNEIWESALDLAAEWDHPVYDTLFVAAAIKLETRVVTYDRRLRARFPQHALTPAEFLRS